MGQLDQWVDEAVIQPLFAVWQGQRETEHDEISYKGVELTTYGVSARFGKRCWKATTTAKRLVLKASSGQYAGGRRHGAFGLACPEAPLDRFISNARLYAVTYLSDSGQF